MSDTDFDTALITAAFRLAGEQGWRALDVVAAARAAGVPLPEARARFPNRAAILLRFGRMADQAALDGAPAEGPVRDRLFDLLMRRFDALQAHRAGVIALMRALPTDPALALLLTCATRRSMRWMLSAAGASTAGLRGEMRVRGLMAVWLWTLRAWERDGSADLSGTMAALDAALRRAERAADWLGGRRSAAPQGESTGETPPVEPGAGEMDPAHPPPDDGTAAAAITKPPDLGSAASPPA